MDTTIQISNSLKKELIKRKFLIEDNQELSEQTKKEIAQSRNEYKAGKTHTLAKIKKEIAQ